MIYEMRHYLMDRGRMNDNHDRMENHTPALLRKHGVNVIGRWAALTGPGMPMFCYIMEWEDFAEREAAWGGFYADPEWPRIRTATNAGSEMVQENKLTFMRPNPVFRQVDSERDARGGGLHQLIVQKTAIGLTGAVNDFLAETWLPRVQAAGARVLGLCDVISGPPMPSVVTLLSWPDETAWFRGWRAFENDPAVIAAYAEQRRTHGQALLGAAETWLMEPAAYALPVASLRTSPR